MVETLLSIWATIAMIVGFLSMLVTLLPPVEWFDRYPRWQTWYRRVVMFVNHYGALNLRGKIAARFPNSPFKKNG